MPTKILLKNKTFSNFSDWASYNKEITGVDLTTKTFDEIKKECLLYIFNKNKFHTIRADNQPIVQIKNILYIDNESITCFQQVSGKDKIYIKKLHYEERILIVPRDKTKVVDKIINKFLSTYAQTYRKVKKIEEEKRQYLRREYKKVQERVSALFSWETDPVSIKELAEKDKDIYSYYCPFCENYFSYMEPQVKCEKCKHYLIELQKELIEKDYK